MNTMRERMLAVHRGQDLDRVPFVQYDSISATNHEICDAIGRDNMGLLRWCGVHRLEQPNCRMDAEALRGDGLEGVKTTMVTSEGTLEQVKWYDPTYHTAATAEHFVKKPEDYRILACFLRDTVVVEDTTTLDAAISDMGDDGLPLVAVARTPYQQLWVQWVSLTDLCFHLVDLEDTMEEIVVLLDDIQQRICDVVWKVSGRIEIPFVDIPDNVTAPTIGENYFRRFCVGPYRRLSDMLAERDIPVIVHMDGDLKPLWKAIPETGIRGIDSFSPPPDNDTSVAEAVAMWPDMRILLNFPSSIHMADPQRIYQTTGQILDQGGHTGRIWIQISENVPPGRWKVSYPQIVRAIQDFGKP